MPEQTPTSLAARWLREAAQEPFTDLQVLEVVDRCRNGSSVNEPALLRDLVAHADAIVDGAATISSAGGVGHE